ncbi:tRNA (N6-isopentenyl adenosine(37)-C2)-methylthiotransferase MiaB [Sphingoaurantiacus capsulatus]|uniref:tRNA-2-methylthio-N(6)-dimethylallyladenosine synthase n=1 Tax=Sphingoaurantiacus capsulatus TaxID=1771310 RepID=A0ABV7X869_9SPHN
MTKPQTYFVKTFGCQMNVYDSERMSELLTAEGMRAVDNSDDADLVVLNTCHIREKAAEKVYSDIGRLKASKRPSGVKPMVAVAGCVAQAEGEEIVRRAPAVDVVVGPQAYHRLPEMLAQAAEARAVDTDMPLESKFAVLPRRAKQSGPSAFLTVQEGCDKFCTFCVVPYTRGAEVSRPAEDVIAEARMLVEGGARELTLLGQNVNAFNGSGVGFAQLIREIAAIEGLARLRYTTSHPRDMDDDLIAVHAEVPELMPYLHLPVQSGSSRILKRMNRAHTAESYLATIEKLRAARPDIALSGDFIVGFPGETEADFEDTLSIVRAVGYAQAYSFKYSSRPGTPAAGMDGHLDEEVKSERLARLQALIVEQAFAFNRATVGRRVEVLMERQGKKPGQLIGKSPYLQSVHVMAPGLAIGDLVEVELLSAGPNSLEGALIQKAAA